MYRPYKEFVAGLLTTIKEHQSSVPSPCISVYVKSENMKEFFDECREAIRGIPGSMWVYNLEHLQTLFMNHFKVEVKVRHQESEGQESIVIHC